MNKAISNALSLKSKTINTNMAAGALVTLLSELGVDLSMEAVTAFFVIANIVLRFLTDKGLHDK